ncbi:hypothetical protein [Candidatus Hodgkinia cicadicola]|uniref:hypothetical protein n=1 Tax=Candidatus Hodgkinia cicadicola TaxID=573658 RepID=UPI0011BACF93
MSFLSVVLRFDMLSVSYSSFISKQQGYRLSTTTSDVLSISLSNELRAYLLFRWVITYNDCWRMEGWC